MEMIALPKTIENTQGYAINAVGSGMNLLNSISVLAFEHSTYILYIWDRYTHM